ncbi:MAG: DivIVA domain-containing protein, partial [Oscillospiraceae bacterium]|nr:DivIVA domain-containing protein [Oscillospiraceae bacterium]
MFTPADIHNKEFRRGFRGYNEEEVDDFLDEIVADYESMTKRIAELEGGLALAMRKGEQYQGMEKQLQETLAVAQKTAEEVVKTARQRADEKLRETELECERKRRQTEAECEGLRREAEADIRRQYENVTARVKEQQVLYDDAVRHRRQLIVKLKSLLRSELELLDGDLGTEAVGSEPEGVKGAAPAEAALPAEMPSQETVSPEAPP